MEEADILCEDRVVWKTFVKQSQTTDDNSQHGRKDET